MIRRCRLLDSTGLRRQAAIRSGGAGDDRCRNDGRSRAGAVRDDVAVPLPVRPAHARACAARRGDADALVPRRRRGLAQADPLLRDVDADQLRDRCRDGARAGVPVRDELVDLLEVRGRRVRRAAGDRGARGVHAGVDVPRSLDLRLGPALDGASTWRPSGCSRSAPGSPRSSSSSRIRGCSGRSARLSPTAAPS